jgi:hypothetical protein
MKRTLCGFALAAGALIAASPVNAACERAWLQQMADRYVVAQSSGDLGWLHLPATVDYSENRKAKDIKSGMLAQKLRIDHRRHLLDAEQCATFTELVVTDPAHPYVIGTQMRFADGVLKSMTSIVTDADDWAFNAKWMLHFALKDDWSPIPPEKRDSRAVIKAAADAYLDRFSDTKVVVPWGMPCRRLEGGVSTGKGLPTDTCNLGMPDKDGDLKLVNRIYVIDETVGTVDVISDFGEGGPADTHEFRVLGGKLVQAHTMTASGDASSNAFPKIVIKTFEKEPDY